MKQYGTILIVDDNTSILTAMRYLLDGVFQNILTLENPDDILKLMAQQPVELVVLDMNFTLGVNSGQDGLFWLRTIRKQHPQTPVVLLTKTDLCADLPSKRAQVENVAAGADVLTVCASAGIPFRLKEKSIPIPYSLYSNPAPANRQNRN